MTNYVIFVPVSMHIRTPFIIPPASMIDLYQNMLLLYSAILYPLFIHGIFLMGLRFDCLLSQQFKHMEKCGT